VGRMVSPSGEVAAGVLLNKTLDTGQGLHPLPLDRGSTLVREALRDSVAKGKPPAVCTYRKRGSLLLLRGSAGVLRKTLDSCQRLHLPYAWTGAERTLEGLSAPLSGPL
jgi:hypothetical protein